MSDIKQTDGRAYCKKCDTYEDQDWDYEVDGIWTCNCKPKNDDKGKSIDNFLREYDNER